MERQKVKNQYTNQYYTPKDFVKGKDIYLNKYVFRLIDCDEFTKKYMIDNAEIFRDSDLGFVMNRIRTGSKNIGLDQFGVDFLATIDPQGTNYVEAG